MPLVTQNGLTFHTQRLGEAGTTVVMLHGLLVGSMTTWYFSAAPAVARTHRVLLYDLRGHGKSSRAATGYDLATQCGDLDALLRMVRWGHPDEEWGPANDAEPVILVGHSYGALIALDFALRHPGCVRRLVLVEAPLPPWRVGELGAFMNRSPAEMIAALPPMLAGAIERGGRAASKLAAQISFLATNSTLFGDLAAQKDYDLTDALRSRLARLDLPVLCVYGETSSCRDSGEWLAKAIPGASLAILPGGHFLPVESPAQVTGELVRFLDG